MAETTSTVPPTQNRTKLLLIPVLAAAFLYLVCAPAEPSGSAIRIAAPSSSTSSQPQLTNVKDLKSTRPLNSIPIASRVTWPSTPLADVLAHNPFKLPAELRLITNSIPINTQPTDNTVDLDEQDEAKKEELRAAIKGQRLAALVKTKKGLGAIIGESVISVGDKVGDRLRVTSIRPDGVVFELVDIEKTDAD